MKQEHRLVAEVYRYLAPFIDTTKDIYLGLDGQAALTASTAGRFVDPNLPDLWFTLLGRPVPCRIEAKILDQGKALLMQSQIVAWRTRGTGAYKPDYWVAANRELSEFYFWDDAAFLPALDASGATRKTHQLNAPKDRMTFKNAPELVMCILREQLKTNSAG